MSKLRKLLCFLPILLLPFLGYADDEVTTQTIWETMHEDESGGTVHMDNIWDILYQTQEIMDSGDQWYVNMIPGADLRPFVSSWYSKYGWALAAIFFGWYFVEMAGGDPNRDFKRLLIASVLFIAMMVGHEPIYRAGLELQQAAPQVIKSIVEDSPASMEFISRKGSNEIEVIKNTIRKQISFQVGKYLMWAYMDDTATGASRMPTMAKKVFLKAESLGLYYLPDTVATEVSAGEELKLQPKEDFQTRFDHWQAGGMSGEYLKNALADMLMENDDLGKEFQKITRSFDILKSPESIEELSKTTGKLTNKQLANLSVKFGKAIILAWAKDEIVLMEMPTEEGKDPRWAKSIPEVDSCLGTVASIEKPLEETWLNRNGSQLGSFANKVINFFLTKVTYIIYNWIYFTLMLALPLMLHPSTQPKFRGIVKSLVQVIIFPFIAQVLLMGFDFAWLAFTQVDVSFQDGFQWEDAKGLFKGIGLVLANSAGIFAIINVVLRLLAVYLAYTLSQTLLFGEKGGMVGAVALGTMVGNWAQRIGSATSAAVTGGKSAAASAALRGGGGGGKGPSGGGSPKGGGSPNGGGGGGSSSPSSSPSVPSGVNMLAAMNNQGPSTVEKVANTNSQSDKAKGEVAAARNFMQSMGQKPAGPDVKVPSASAGSGTVGSTNPSPASPSTASNPSPNVKGSLPRRSPTPTRLSANTVANAVYGKG